MSASSQKKKMAAGPGVGHSKMPKLPPIPKLMTTKDRFDNSPLLKYRRTQEVKNILGSKV